MTGPTTLTRPVCRAPATSPAVPPEPGHGEVRLLASRAMNGRNAGDFAVLLRRLRDAAALTQEELAERAGLTTKAIGALERGERRRPYPHTVRALSDALRLDETGRAPLAAAARPGPRRGARAAPVATEAPSAPRGPPLVGRRRELDDL